MSANGYILNGELPAYHGFYAELNPSVFPLTTLALKKGIRVVDNKRYGLTFHTETAETTYASNKGDNAAPTFGSTGFTTGSNILNVFNEGAAITWARQGEQDLGRTLGYQNPSNPSVEPNPMVRARVDALLRIKGGLEYLSLNGNYNDPAVGTTGSFEQQGLKNSGMTVGTASGAVPGAGTLGTLGTITETVVVDTLQTIWSNRLWSPGRPMLAICNATVKRAFSELMRTTYNIGKNGESINVAGINVERFVTDFGIVDIILTHNFPSNDLYFVNYDYIEMLARPIPGYGIFRETELARTTAADALQIYTEQGFNWVTPNAHGRILGIGSTVVGGQAVS